MFEKKMLENFLGKSSAIVKFGYSNSPHQFFHKNSAGSQVFLKQSIFKCSREAKCYGV